MCVLHGVHVCVSLCHGDAGPSTGSNMHGPMAAHTPSPLRFFNSTTQEKKPRFAPKRLKTFLGPIDRSLMSAFDCTRFCDVASSIDGASSMSSRDTGISTYKWARATCLPVMAQWRPLGAFCSHQHPQRPPGATWCARDTHTPHWGFIKAKKRGKWQKKAQNGPISTYPACAQADPGTPDSNAHNEKSIGS